MNGALQLELDLVIEDGDDLDIEDDDYDDWKRFTRMLSSQRRTAIFSATI